MAGRPIGACRMLSLILGRFWPFVGVDGGHVDCNAWRVVAPHRCTVIRGTHGGLDTITAAGCRTHYSAVGLTTKCRLSFNQRA